MYKLFLCLRYLRKLVMAYFAMLCVALCVAMMLIVTSVMNGFLDKIEKAAKGLFGDVTIFPASQHGLPLYDELMAEITSQVPEVEAATPFIMTYGALRLRRHPQYRRPVQIAGIRLPERVHASDFGEGLFVQAGVAEPTFDPPAELMLRRLAEESARTRTILQRESQTNGAEALPPEKEALCRRLRTALSLQALGADNIRNAPANARALKVQLDMLAQAEADGADTKTIDRLETELALLEDHAIEPPGSRVILGLRATGLEIRTTQGETVRMLGPGGKVILYVFPLGRGFSLADSAPNIAAFTIVDDCRTDVSSIDSSYVYVPFETLQKLNNMDQPNRCSEIHLKVKDAFANERDLRKVAQRIDGICATFQKTHSRELADVTLNVQTWRQRQAQVIGPIEKQRTLTIIMFTIMSLVSVVLIFVIFYMIVYQKVRDIGVLKAIGASSGGVAGLFLAYGAAVGLVGAAAGGVGGYYFVRHINDIQDAIDRWFGMRIWDRDVFIFDRIPDQVSIESILLIAVSAVAAGLLGALVPAIRAARMQPVEALRYE